MKLDSIIGTFIEDALAKGVSSTQCTESVNLKKWQLKYKKKPVNYKKYIWLTSLIVVLFAIKNPDLYRRPKDFIKEFREDYLYSPSSDTCILTQSGLTLELTRPISNCDVCKSIKEVPVVYNMTGEYFLKHYAYTGAPILIKKGAANWSALSIFSYKYFKLLYDKLEAYDENDDLGCQFFPYKTNFQTLKQVFKMSKKRAALKKDQWYIGWSNCVPRVMKALRRHYSRPPFLPHGSESSNLDWMFMGGSGTGAQMHIDAVNRPSWQAMIKGKKTWYLEPLPECETVCEKHLSITMEPGDILVVDTNRWYHSTFIHPGNLSLTIGSEYD